jgi:NADPH-dependent ferric siderophore reductase
MQNNPNIINAILAVKEKEYITPHYIRITLTGDDVPLFINTRIGANNKIFLPSNSDQKIYFDQEKSERRTFTHRGIDLEKKEMIIDFAAHGNSGPASAWAINAKPGDELGVAMKSTTAELYPQADWYLLVADATGIPVLAAIFESLPIGSKGVAVIEVLNKEEEIPFNTASDIQINWVHNATPGEKSPLIAAVRNLFLPNKNLTSCFGYVAAEFTTVKEVRQYLRKEKGWDKEELNAYSYWKYGKSENGSVEERQEEKNRIIGL